MSILSFPLGEIKPPSTPDALGRWVHNLANGPCPEDRDPAGSTLHYAVGWEPEDGAPVVLDWGVNLRTLSLDLVRVFRDLSASGDIALWSQEPGSGPRLVGVVQPGPDGYPVVRWF